MADKVTFEAGLARLEEIVTMLEKGDAPLDRLLSLFEEGTKLAKACSGMLDKAEQKVLLLTKDGAGGATAEPFGGQAEF